MAGSTSQLVLSELLRELEKLALSLIRRMRIDLLGNDDDAQFGASKEDAEDLADHDPNFVAEAKKWLAHPKTLRLTTRPRLPLRPDGTRERTMKRISHSCPLPNYVFNLQDSVDAVAEKLVGETLVNMFRKLHPEKSGWNLSLVNVAVTNMAESAGESKTASGRDIGNMFKRQDDVLKDFRVVESSPEPEDSLNDTAAFVDRDAIVHSRMFNDGNEEEWIEDEGLDQSTEFCKACGAHIPSFAMVAHQRFHTPEFQ